MAFQEATGNVNNYVDASKGLAVYECFVNEWISCKEKWEGYITCKLNHLGCTSTQRAESSHHALKKGLSAVLPLEGTFRNVNEFINNFERKYCQLEIEEATRVDILLYGDFQLQKLFKKVRYRAPSKVKFSALYALYDNVVSLIKKNAVLYTFDPKGDGWCGYRVVAEMMEKNENMFPRVKGKMLHVFEKYKNVYRENFLFQDLDHLKKNIENRIDWATTTRCSKYSGDRFFYTPDNNSNVKAVTYLPIDYMTDKSKQRSPKPLISVKVGRKIQKQWIHVLYCLFAFPCCIEEFNTYWNKDNMFSYPVERNNRSLSGLSEDVLIIESDRDDE
ncbi:hypothetical protein AB4K20DRAFT_1971057 [Rhizopus microsporus]